MKDKDYMYLALELAARARGYTTPNPMVGCVIVKNNRIVGQGYHKRFGGAHAEVNALKQAGSKARGATLYVTLEPCAHYGKTPPCLERVLNSGVKRVVVAMKDPNPLVNGKSLRRLKSQGIRVQVGLLKEEAEHLNEMWLTAIKTGMPFVVAKCAQTLDGKIATASGHSQWITSQKTRAYTHRMRDHFDAILVGSKTALKDNPRLNGSRKTKKLKKIIVDSTLKLPLNARLLQGVQPKDCIIATTSRASKRKIAQFEKKGVQVWMDNTAQKRVSLKRLFKVCGKYNVTSILIEGGGEIIGSALKEGLVHRMLFVVAPKILGSHQARNAIDGLDIRNVNHAVRLKNLKIQPIDKDYIITGYVHRNR